MDNRRLESPLDKTESRGPEGLSGPAKDRAVDLLEFARQIAAALHERIGNGVQKGRFLVSLSPSSSSRFVADPQILSTRSRHRDPRAAADYGLGRSSRRAEEFNRLAKFRVG